MPPPAAPLDEAGALAPLPVANLRLRSFVGSMREDQSELEGGTSIHSSRFGGLETSSSVACVIEASCWRWEVWGWLFVGGSKGPKSSSSEEEPL